MFNKWWVSLTRGRLKGGKIWRFFSILLTFNFVSFAWIFFRAESMENARLMLNRIFYSFSPGNISSFIQGWLPVLTVVLSGYIIHFLPARIKESYRGLFIRLPIVVQLLFVYLVAVALYNIQSTDIQPFIYFRF